MILILDSNGVIVNATQTGPAFPPSGGSTVTLTDAQTARYYTGLGVTKGGLAYVNDVFVPQTVTAGSFMQALIDLGFYNAVAAVVQASGNQTAQVLWARAVTFARQDALLIQMATAAGMTSADMDAVFVKAATY